MNLEYSKHINKEGICTLKACLWPGIAYEDRHNSFIFLKVYIFENLLTLNALYQKYIGNITLK